MARGTVSLLLLVALYLGLTLVVSSDENLLINGQVALPQTGVGISIVQSYIFAPPIFLYLHIQTLYLLSVLARKVHTFETALAKEFPGTNSQEGQNKIQPKKYQEYWDWLSAFAFVQLFRQDDVSLLSTVLTWLSTIVIPLLLLFTIDLSFVRYQSTSITISHHIIFLLDLLSVEMFRRRMLIPTLVKISLFAADTAKVAWVFCILFMIIMIFNAFPPRFQLRTVTQDQYQIWRGSKVDKKNLLDAGPCEWWGLACRYLEVSRARLMNMGPEDLDDVDMLELSRRNLRFGKFVNARMTNANLNGAVLQGATLRSAQLKGVNFEGALLQASTLRNADLQDTNLKSIRLQSADLRRAQLQNADLEMANLQGADLSQAQMRGANLNWAQLQGTNLKSAQMQGVTLGAVQLQGANLNSANLEGADLNWAQLQGADLSQAVLKGTDLSQAQLQSSFGKPTIDQNELILMHYPVFGWDLNLSPSQHLVDLLANIPAEIKLVWKNGMTLVEHLRKSIEQNQSSPNLEDWPLNIDLDYSEYSKSWAKWTSDFACLDVYTARSSVRRWRTYHLGLNWVRTMKFDAKTFPIYPTQVIYDAIVDAHANREDCIGLRSLPDDEWIDFYTRQVLPILQPRTLE